jgi:hypothetical protein
VVTISNAAGSVWLGNIRHVQQYQALLEWASQSKGAGGLVPLPTELGGCRFDPFRCRQPIAEGREADRTRDKVHY